MSQVEFDSWHMARALELALRGEGHVEPNPMVGCVIAGPGGVVGEGWHRRFGEEHAEIAALRAAGSAARGATAYVTLEPCCHTGKTPPCTKALIAAGIRRVMAAQLDPFAAVRGRGFAELATAGVDVEVGLMEADARRVNAPYLKLLATGRPWLIAKWAMTLDGKIATRTGDSRWITSPEARQIGQALRGRVDAILVGRGTAAADDPLLLARPAGPRLATRVVLDTCGSISSESRLVCTANEGPVLIVVGEQCSQENRGRLAAARCEVFVAPGSSPAERLDALLAELGRRRMTNVLVEGGSQLLGSLWDARAINEIYAFIAPKILGGAEAPSPIAGLGIGQIADALTLESPTVQQLGPDVCISGRLKPQASSIPYHATH
jgi:diaminohydroxyphosphoribosylaminopyrimidine deaminase/5-amino-6-(5-phosphoribosylamino)uracil reductase